MLAISPTWQPRPQPALLDRLGTTLIEKQQTDTTKDYFSSLSLGVIRHDNCMFIHEMNGPLTCIKNVEANNLTIFQLLLHLAPHVTTVISVALDTLDTLLL